MRERGIEPPRAAHFLMKLMFGMFGEDVGLLPAGLFSRLLEDGNPLPEGERRTIGAGVGFQHGRKSTKKIWSTPLFPQSYLAGPKSCNIPPSPAIYSRGKSIRHNRGKSKLCPQSGG
jgi:hypothetical protein